MLLNQNVGSLKAQSTVYRYAPVAPESGDVLAAACVDLSVLPRDWIRCSAFARARLLALGRGRQQRLAARPRRFGTVELFSCLGLLCNVKPSQGDKKSARQRLAPQE